MSLCLLKWFTCISLSNWVLKNLVYLLDLYHMFKTLCLFSFCVELVQKRTEVVTQLKYLQAQTEPIVKCFEDPEFNNQMQTTR